MLSQVVFIVWRESIEALLVVGILFTWLNHNPQYAAGRKYLWFGVAGGVLAALALGGVLLWFAELLDGEREDYFQLAVMLVASGLIVQMVFWMRAHGRGLKRSLESGLAGKAATASWWGMALLVVLAIAREGSETVVFLYGMGLTQAGIQWLSFSAAALLGLVLAFATFALLQLGGRLFTWQRFFKFTEVLLLLLASALWVSSVERMIGLEWLTVGLDPVWDTSAWLDDGTVVGSMVAAFTGYRAQPTLALLLLLAVFWGALAAGFYRQNHKKNAT